MATIEKLINPSSTAIFPMRDCAPLDLNKFKCQNNSHHTNFKRHYKCKRFHKSWKRQQNETTQQSKDILSEIHDKIEFVVEEYLNQHFKNILLQHLNEQKVMEKLFHQSSQTNLKTSPHQHTIGKENHYKSSKIKKTKNYSPKHTQYVRQKCKKKTHNF